MPGQTPSQTVGPFFAYGLAPQQYGHPMKSLAGGNLADEAIAGEAVAGERIRILGQVLDGEGAPIGDALVEIWQADAEGRYAHPADRRGANTGFRGFGRQGTGTDPHNRFIFDTVKPGSVDGQQAPHVNVIVFMRGLLSHAYTRMYFADEADANARDPVLASVPEERRATLLAKPEARPAGAAVTAVTAYRFDIHMQGDAETVFFDM